MGQTENGTRIIASVIVCTHNRASLLKRVLDSLVRQTMALERFEVIVVDDGSEDETQGLVREMIARHPLIRLVSTGKNVGLRKSRNLGLDYARGNYILFTDDDCIAKENWVEKMCVTLDNQSIVAGSIESPKSGYAKLCHNIAHFHPFMPGCKSGPVDFLAGANMGFHRNVIDELGGFEEGMNLAGDMQLCLLARSRGYQPYLNQEAAVVHDPDYISLAGAIKSSYTHAAATILLRNVYASVLNTPFVLKSPFFLLLASPLIAAKVTLDIYFKNPKFLALFWTAPFVCLLKFVWCLGAAQGLREGAKKKDG